MGDKDQSPCSFGDDEDSEGQNVENVPYSKTDMIETESGIDWFSKLPDSLIVEILSLMPITDACQTTILSKRWRYMWTSIGNVLFGFNVYISCSFGVNPISFMENALRLLSCSNIKKFHLHFDFIRFEDPSILDKWLGISVEKSVRDLELSLTLLLDDDDDPELYKLPQVLCSCSSLEKLESRNCNISEDSVISWISLKSLSLLDLVLTDKDIAKIISGCPQLESLELCNFMGFRRLHMTSLKCRTLKLNGHWSPCPSKDDCSLEIVAPYVQHREISGELNCLRVSSLVHTELTCSIRSK